MKKLTILKSKITSMKIMLKDQVECNQMLTLLIIQPLSKSKEAKKQRLFSNNSSLWKIQVIMSMNMYQLLIFRLLLRVILFSKYKLEEVSKWLIKRGMFTFKRYWQMLELLSKQISHKQEIIKNLDLMEGISRHIRYIYD